MEQKKVTFSGNISQSVPHEISSLVSPKFTTGTFNMNVIKSFAGGPKKDDSAGNIFSKCIPKFEKLTPKYIAPIFGLKQDIHNPLALKDLAFPVGDSPFFKDQCFKSGIPISPILNKRSQHDEIFAKIFPRTTSVNVKIGTLVDKPKSRPVSAKKPVVQYIEKLKKSDSAIDLANKKRTRLKRASISEICQHHQIQNGMLWYKRIDETIEAICKNCDKAKTSKYHGKSKIPVYKRTSISVAKSSLNTEKLVTQNKTCRLSNINSNDGAKQSTTPEVKKPHIKGNTSSKSK